MYIYSIYIYIYIYAQGFSHWVELGGSLPPLPPLKTALLAVVIVLLHFCFNFILFGRTGQVNFHFN